MQKDKSISLLLSGFEINPAFFNIFNSFYAGSHPLFNFLFLKIFRYSASVNVATK